MVECLSEYKTILPPRIEYGSASPHATTLYNKCFRLIQFPLIVKYIQFLTPEFNAETLYLYEELTFNNSIS
jgi:hypothetical protein